jgi:hypothetical protein
MTTDRVRYGQPALIKHGHVSADMLPAFIREALRDIRAYMHEHDLHPAGPPFATSTASSEPGKIDVETGWPLEHEAVGAGAIHSATLPCTLARHTNPRELVA